MEYLEIGKRIKRLREARAISQKDAAQQIGIQQSTLSKYERGIQNPRFQELCLMADWFGVSVDYLLCRTEIPSIPTDGKLQAAAEVTQLSEAALQVLAALKYDHTKLLSELLSTTPIETLLDLIAKYIHTSIPRFKQSTNIGNQIAENYNQLIPMTIDGTSVFMQESSFVASVLQHEIFDGLDTIAYLHANGGADNNGKHNPTP